MLAFFSAYWPWLLAAGALAALFCASLATPMRAEVRAHADFCGCAVDVKIGWLFFHKLIRLRFRLLAPPVLSAEWYLENGRITAIQSKRSKEKKHAGLLAALRAVMHVKRVQVRVCAGRKDDAAGTALLCGALVSLLSCVLPLLIDRLAAPCDEVSVAAAPAFGKDSLSLDARGIVKAFPAQFIWELLKRRGETNDPSH